MQSSAPSQPFHPQRPAVGLLRVLPAEGRGDGEDAVGVGRAAGAAGAQFRLGDLRRRRLHPRAHARHRQAHPQRDGADAGRASDLRRRDLRRRSTTSCAAITTPACATSWRCAAISVDGPGTRYAPHPGGYENAADLVAGIKKHRARLRGLGLGLSGEPSRQPDAGSRHRHAEGQGRCRRDARHHPVLLR